MNFYLLLIIAYLAGSIPFGKIVGRANDIDIQKVGSGNIGFANSLRTMGWKPALLVLFGDMLKGYLPTYVAVREFHLGTPTLIIALACVLGHIASPWLSFRGGKGVATLVGASIALFPIIGLIGMGIWIIMFFSTKISAVASLTLAFALPLLSVLFAPSLIYFYLATLAIILITHRRNISGFQKRT